MKKGFTLIELLVVVLIIGILAAVALPQYTKAVEKSRATEAISYLGDLATAERVFQMATGAFAKLADIGKLDIELPSTFKSYTLRTIDVDTTTGNLTAALERTGGAATYTIAMSLTKEPGAPSIWCIPAATAANAVPAAAAALGSDTADNICKSISNGSATGVIR
jgi:prepilin-type N-terminal cleavage/methylation domain-containing protein